MVILWGNGISDTEFKDNVLEYKDVKFEINVRDRRGVSVLCERQSMLTKMY